MPPSRTSGRRPSRLVESSSPYRFPEQRKSISVRAPNDGTRSAPPPRPRRLQGVPFADGRSRPRDSATAPPSYHRRVESGTDGFTSIRTASSDLSDGDMTSASSDADSDELAPGGVGPTSRQGRPAVSASLNASSMAKQPSLHVKPPTRRRERRSNRPEGQPPRPMNSWMQYRSKRISEMRQAYGDTAQFGAQSELSKRIAEDWAGLSAKEKVLYERMAEEARLEHQRLYPGACVDCEPPAIWRC